MVGLVEPKGYKRSSHNYFQYKPFIPKYNQNPLNDAAVALSTISLRIDCQTSLIRYLQAV